jgi:hypothetical protein
LESLSLYELLRYRDPQIVCNSLFALLNNSGGVRFDMNLIHHIINSLPKFSEWAQSEAMQVISQYRPENDTETFDLMNIVDQFLSSASLAVLSIASRILLALTNDKGEIQCQVVMRVLPKFITHIHAGSAELQLCLLKHLVVLARRFPIAFKSQPPHFFVDFSDDPAVSRAKVELLQITTDNMFAREVTETTARSVLLEKPFLIQLGIKLIRRCDSRRLSRPSSRRCAFSST